MSNDSNPEPEKVAEPKVLKDEEIPEHVKRIIDQQSNVLESNQREIISVKTDMQDLRTGLGPLLELAEQIKKAQQQEQTQQPTAQTAQQNQGSANGLPLQNFDLNTIQALASAAGNILQTLSPLLQQYGLIPSGNTEGLTSLLLDNNKRFNKWVDLLVNKTLNKAIGLTLSTTEQQIIESTESAAPHTLA